MTREWRLFRFALQFLTRIPTPRQDALPSDWLARSAKYFPVVGALVGGLSAIVLLGASEIWRAGPLPALLALAAGLATTGALHEDGLADTADGLGGGRSPEQRLAIMKDPRLGAYGALALGLALAGKAAALTNLPAPLAAAGLISAHVGARTAAVWIMSILPYAAEPAVSKVDAPLRTLRPCELGLASAFALAPPLLLIAPVEGIACMVGAAVAAFLVSRACARRIGGHTGDVLGAVEQTYELVFLLVLSGLSASAYFPA